MTCRFFTARAYPRDPARNRPPRAIDRIRSGSKPSAAMVVASSRDAWPNSCQLRFSRSSFMAPHRLECSRSSCHERPGTPPGWSPSARATVRAATVLLGGVKPVVSDHADELTPADVISGGGEDFSAFAVSRWPGLVRLAFGLTGDRWAAEDLAQAT